jgi:hypothetical protein
VLRGLLVIACACACVAACSESSSTSNDHSVPVPCTPLADPAVAIRYEGVTPEGRYVVVLAGPTERVFYGTREHMVEGRITGTSVGCARYYNFVVEGRSYAAVFANATCGPDVLSRLIAGEEGGPMVTQLLEVLVGAPRRDAGAEGGADAGTPAPSPDAFSFYCL